MKPTENKTVQARIIGYAEAIFRRRSYGGQGDFSCALSRREMNLRERRDRNEDFDWAIWPQAVAKFPGRPSGAVILAQPVPEFLAQAVRELVAAVPWGHLGEYESLVNRLKSYN